jgi:hypothetical protein
MIDKTTYPGLVMNNLSLGQGGTGSTTPERDSQSRLGFHLRDTENVRYITPRRNLIAAHVLSANPSCFVLQIAEKEKALAILQKQRIHLGSQAEQLICNSISLYELGVSLEIFPFDPDLKQLLSIAHGRFRSLWQSAEEASQDETRNDRTGSETDGVDSLDYAGENRNTQVN